MTTESSELKTLLKSLEHPNLKAIDLSLQRIERHLAAIDNPERRIPPVIHVAGTNGKGSTIAFLRAMLEAAGYRCHIFTSPHLVHFRERIVVAGQMLQEAVLIEKLEQIRARMQDYPLTFFEANTVAAFELFAAQEADFTLLEVGMGGRFDATNVIEQPLLSIITPVSMDHQAFLGNELGKIAYEKAGIIKAAVPVVVAPQADAAMQVIEKVAQEVQAPIIPVQPEPLHNLALKGVHQQMNASVAMAAARYLAGQGYDAIDEPAISDGLAGAKWPGRLQRLTHGVLADAASGTEIWLDGGHNEDAALQLARWAQQQEKPVHLICAMTNQKDPHAFLKPLVPHVASITAIPIQDEPLSMPASQLYDAAKALHHDVWHCETAVEAVMEIGPEAIVLIAGSLYLCGLVLENNG